jgi:predicted PolB exonuclease-like 3'-5' exonuclease
MANISLIRWEMDGRVGYGDAQDVLWNDFVNAAAEARVRT